MPFAFCLSSLGNLFCTTTYRIVNKQEGQTKHEYFLEMLDEVKAWGLKPETVTGDSWYAAKETMNTLKDKGFRGLFAPHVNRLVSVELGTK